VLEADAPERALQISGPTGEPPRQIGTSVRRVKLRCPDGDGQQSL